MKSKLIEWMKTFVEVPNVKLGNFAPCPYARAARINNQIEIVECEAKDLYSKILELLPVLESKEVLVLAFDHTQIDPVTLQEFVRNTNSDLMKNNYVILEDHPDAVEYVNGIKMNFGYCGLLIIQKLDKLNSAADQLREKGYYKHWDELSLDSVVKWRYIHHEVR